MKSETLTRDQVEELCNDLLNDNLLYSEAEQGCEDLKNTDAAQRARIKGLKVAETGWRESAIKYSNDLAHLRAERDGLRAALLANEKE